MVDDPYRARYLEHVRRLEAQYPKPRAIELAVGGEFAAFGILERELLIHHGLRASDFLIDVGCGSGRLAVALREYLRGPYLGIDVVPDLLLHARSIAARSDWRFELAENGSIPERDGAADMVCFFSVLTHLPHERAYRYVREARRVLRRGGKIVFSFLEFAVPAHWPVFEAALAAPEGSAPWTQFLSRDAIAAWADKLDLSVIAIERGDEPTIPLPEPVVMEAGTRLERVAAFGQSVCVLSA
jgi:SAM-dependent methyltransferase